MGSPTKTQAGFRFGRRGARIIGIPTALPVRECPEGEVGASGGKPGMVWQCILNVRDGLAMDVCCPSSVWMGRRGMSRGLEGATLPLDIDRWARSQAFLRSCSSTVYSSCSEKEGTLGSMPSSVCRALLVGGYRHGGAVWLPTWAILWNRLPVRATALYGMETPFVESGDGHTSESALQCRWRSAFWDRPLARSGVFNCPIVMLWRPPQHPGKPFALLAWRQCSSLLDERSAHWGGPPVAQVTLSIAFYSGSRSGVRSTFACRFPRCSGPGLRRFLSWATVSPPLCIAGAWHWYAPEAWCCLSTVCLLRMKRLALRHEASCHA